MHTRNKKQRGWLASVFTGTGIALGITLILSAIITGLILNEKIGEGSAEKIICAIQFLSVFVGAELAKNICRTNDVRIPVIVTVAYAGMIVIGGILLEGKFQNMWPHIAAEFAGCLFSCVLCFWKPRRSGKRKKRIW